MKGPKPGDRVYAIRNIEDETKTVYLYGYGVYEGDYLPEGAANTSVAAMVKELGIDNPRIKLDNGKIVWGCECWWGEEEEFKKNADKFTVIEVDIEQDRKEQEELS